MGEIQDYPDTFRTLFGRGYDDLGPLQFGVVCAMEITAGNTADLTFGVQSAVEERFAWWADISIPRGGLVPLRRSEESRDLKFARHIRHELAPGEAGFLTVPIYAHRTARPGPRTVKVHLTAQQISARRLPRARHSMAETAARALRSAALLALGLVGVPRRDVSRRVLTMRVVEPATRAQLLSEPSCEPTYEVRWLPPGASRSPIRFEI
jgi:hypothetical protein